MTETGAQRAGDPMTPARIHADRDAGLLHIEWADGHVTEYDTVTLRWMCPCAYCRGEAGLPGWLDTMPTLSPDQTRLADVTLVGRYALAPTWADGHGQGFYTYRALREGCPCPVCTAARAEVAEPAPRAGVGEA